MPGLSKSESSLAFDEIDEEKKAQRVVDELIGMPVECKSLIKTSMVKEAFKEKEIQCLKKENKTKDETILDLGQKLQRAQAQNETLHLVAHKADIDHLKEMKNLLLEIKQLESDNRCLKQQLDEQARFGEVQQKMQEMQSDIERLKQQTEAATASAAHPTQRNSGKEVLSQECQTPCGGIQAVGDNSSLSVTCAKQITIQESTQATISFQPSTFNSSDYAHNVLDDNTVPKDHV